MAKPDRAGLSNPYAPMPVPVPPRPRTGLARAAVLAGIGGAATLGLAGPGGGSAWADTSAAAPVSPDDRGTARCLPRRDPVLHGTARPHGGPAVLPRRCGIPDSWWRQRPADPPRDVTLPGPPPWDVTPPVPPPGDVPLPWKPVVPPGDVPLPEVPVVPGDPIAGSQLVSVEGTVEAGVEPGCEVLRDGGGQQWTLSGPLGTLPHGLPLAVTGVTQPDLLSTCQQGAVLRVRQVSLLDPAAEPGPTVPIATTDLRTEARPVPVSRVYPRVEPACGPTGTGKVPITTLCTR